MTGRVRRVASQQRSSSGTQMESPVTSKGRSRLYFSFALSVDCPASMMIRCINAYRCGVVAAVTSMPTAHENTLAAPGNLRFASVAASRQRHCPAAHTTPDRWPRRPRTRASPARAVAESARCCRVVPRAAGSPGIFAAAAAEVASRRPVVVGTTSRQPTNQARVRRARAASRHARSWMRCSWRQCNGRCGFAKPARHESQPLHRKCAFPALSRCANVGAVTR